jgi:hypothetical protein
VFKQESNTTPQIGSFFLSFLFLSFAFLLPESETLLASLPFPSLPFPSFLPLVILFPHLPGEGL